MYSGTQPQQVEAGQHVQGIRAQGVSPGGNIDNVSPRETRSAALRRISTSPRSQERKYYRQNYDLNVPSDSNRNTYQKDKTKMFSDSKSSGTGSSAHGTTSHRRGTFFGLYNKSEASTLTNDPVSPEESSISGKSSSPSKGSPTRSHLPGTGGGRMSILEQSVPSMFRPGHKDVSSHSDPSIQARFEMWITRTKREVTLAAKHLSIIFETARMGNNSKLDVDTLQKHTKSIEKLSFYTRVHLPLDLQDSKCTAALGQNVSLMATVAEHVELLEKPKYSTSRDPQMRVSCSSNKFLRAILHPA